MTYSVEDARRYWRSLGNIPITEDDELDEDFIVGDTIFQKGTDKFEVWHWFEDTFNVSIAEDLVGIEYLNKIIKYLR